MKGASPGRQDNGEEVHSVYRPEFPMGVGRLPPSI